MAYANPYVNLPNCAVQGCEKKGTVLIEYDGEDFYVCPQHFRELHHGNRELQLATHNRGERYE